MQDRFPGLSIAFLLLLGACWAAAASRALASIHRRVARSMVAFLSQPVVEGAV